MVSLRLCPIKLFNTAIYELGFLSGSTISLPLPSAMYALSVTVLNSSSCASAADAEITPAPSRSIMASKKETTLWILPRLLRRRLVYVRTWVDSIQLAAILGDAMTAIIFVAVAVVLGCIFEGTG